jgi:hypothetical protein
VGVVTIDEKVEKFANPDRIRLESVEFDPSVFAACRRGEVKIDDFRTGIGLISYEDVGFADGFAAHQLIKTAPTAVGVGLAHRLGRHPAVPAVMISEGPENGH